MKTKALIDNLYRVVPVDKGVVHCPMWVIGYNTDIDVERKELEKLEKDVTIRELH